MNKLLLNQDNIEKEDFSNSLEQGLVESKIPEEVDR
jgi:hypothetical protein